MQHSTHNYSTLDSCTSMTIQTEWSMSI